MRKRTVKILLAFIVACVYGSAAYSQKEANIWYFGTKAGLDFNSGTPTVLTGAAINTYEGSATICDPATGDLIFYTDGGTVWYPDQTVVPGGTGLRGASSSTQSALIVPFPNDPDRWYIFTSNVDPGTGTPQGTNYYVVTRTGAALSVGAATNLAASGASTEHLSALGDGAGGYWVVTHATNAGGGTNQFLSWHITSAGVLVSTTPTTSGAGNLMNNYQGTMKANTCQNKIGVTYLNDGIVEVYNFDNTTGQVTSLLYTSSGYSQPYGLEFSPNDDYMYFGTLSGSCYQMNMATGVVTNTGWLPPNNGPNQFGQMQLGPDGKIYVSNTSTSGGNVYLGVINDPNNVYTSANYNRQGVLLSTSGGIDALPQLGLPTFSRTFVSAVTEPLVNGLGVSGTGVYCINTNINFSFTFSGSIDPGSILWDFGDGNTSTSTSPTHSYSTTGIKNVTLTFDDECGRSYSRDFDVDIRSPKIPSGTISCTSTGIVMNANPADPDRANYVWYDAASGGNIYGIGETVTWENPDNASAPGSVWVEVASSVSSSASVTNVVGPVPSWLNGSSYQHHTRFHVLADHVKLNSFQMVPWNWPGACPGTTTLSFNIEIRNAANTIVFLKPYSGTITCGAAITIPVGADLVQGNNYRISLQSFSSNASSWQQIFNGFPVTAAGVATVIGPTANYTTMGNLSFTAEDFTVTTACSQRVQVNRSCTLPVELAYFEAFRQGEQVFLSWLTTMELNNQYFQIERSADGQNYQVIGKVDGNGNSSESIYYSYSDREPLSVVSYYRLVQVDLDGKRHTSPVRVVQAIGQVNDIVLYPNPSAGEFEMTLAGNLENSVIVVTDVLGREIYRKTISVDDIKLSPGADWIPGHYILTWIFEGGSKTIPLVKK